MSKRDCNVARGASVGVCNRHRIPLEPQTQQPYQQAKLFQFFFYQSCESTNDAGQSVRKTTKSQCLRSQMSTSTVSEIWYISVRGSAGRPFIRFLYHMYCLHKTVNTKAVNKDICVRVIGKVSSYK